MEKKQLLNKESLTGYLSSIAPITTFDAVVDENGITLAEHMKDCNHIYLSFTEYSKAKTRCQVPTDMRRKGLWITYSSCQGKTVTEFYTGDSFTDEEWGKNENWADHIDKSYIREVIDAMITWYKA